MGHKAQKATTPSSSKMLSQNRIAGTLPTAILKYQGRVVTSEIIRSASSSIR